MLTRRTLETILVRCVRDMSTKSSAVPGHNQHTAKQKYCGHKLSFSEFGPPMEVVRKEGQRLDDENVPEDKMLVKLLAAPVNPYDLHYIQGSGFWTPKLPAVPGNEGVGMIVRMPKTGYPVEGRRPIYHEGDWVIPKDTGMGTWQSFIVGRPEDFIKIPPMDLASASLLSINPCTAYRLLKDFEDLKPGDTVLQNGGNSSIGQYVIQLCREFELNCVSVVRPREHFKVLKARLLALGNADTKVITDAELRKMRDLKADLVLNCVDGQSATDCVRTLNPGRTMVTYGGISSEPAVLPTSLLIFNDVRVCGFSLYRWIANNSVEARLEMLDTVTQLILNKRLLPPEHKLVAFAKYREALENTLKPMQGVKYVLKMD